MGVLRVVDTPDDDHPTTVSGKPVAPVEVEIVWPDALGVPKVAIYVDPETARQLAHAWSLWNQTYPAQPGRRRWPDDVVDLHRSAIEIETATGELDATGEVTSDLVVVRSLVQEQNHEGNSR